MGSLVSLEQSVLRNGKALKRSSSGEAPDTPQAKEARRRASWLLELPEELLLAHIVAQLDAGAMVALGSCCTRLRELHEGSQPHWRYLFEERFGEATALQEDAAKLASGWQRLYAARHAMEKESQPWQRPTRFEVEAAVRRLAGRAGSARACAAGEDAASSEAQVAVVFLLDGSGSVTEDDFNVMTDFMQTAVTTMATSSCPAKVSVLQFSNDVRVEMSPQPVDVESFGQLMQSMHRMNGGTNISLAVQKAGQLLKPLGEATRRVLVLLTDGRVDSHQAREAHDMARRLADEQQHVELYAFGVGRGVDRQELVHIISATEPEGAEDRYLGLCTLDEAPW